MSKRFLKLGWILMIALLCLALVALPACTAPTEQEEEEEEEGGPAIPFKNPGIFTQMVIGLPETLDYSASYDTSGGEAISYVEESLIAYDGEELAEFIPVLATEWTWNDADRTWTFKIRQNIKFHDGGDLVPEDVEYSFERTMITDRLGGPAALILQPLVGVGTYEETTYAAVDASVEVSGDSVIFKLSDAGYKTPFLQTIAQAFGAIVDKEWCVANGEWDGTEADVSNHYQVEPNYLWTHLNGTGPWKLNLLDAGVQIKFEKNADYWGDPAPFDWIITQLVEEWTTRKQALLAGDIDYTDVDRQYIHELDGIADLNTYEALPTLSSVGFFMVLDINPTSPYIGSGQLDGNGVPGDFFQDADVRKGFAYAMDYATFIRDVYLGEGKQIGLVVEGLYGYDPDVPIYTFDKAKAEERFRAAWGGQLWEKGFKMTILYNAGNNMRKAACEILQKNLLAINAKFQVAIQPLAWSTGILPLIKTKDATTYIIGWGADYPHADNFVYPFMYSSGAFAQFQSYGNPELDAKIKAALLETDTVKQLAAYTELAQIWYDDCPGFFLIQPLGRRFFTKYIEGFYFNPMIPGNAGPLYFMTKSAS